MWAQGDGVNAIVRATGKTKRTGRPKKPGIPRCLRSANQIDTDSKIWMKLAAPV
jgi:hypothetical protein